MARPVLGCPKGFECLFQIFFPRFLPSSLTSHFRIIIFYIILFGEGRGFL